MGRVRVLDPFSLSILREPADRSLLSISDATPTLFKSSVRGTANKYRFFYPNPAPPAPWSRRREKRPQRSLFRQGKGEIPQSDPCTHLLNDEMIGKISMSQAPTGEPTIMGNEVSDPNLLKLNAN